MTPISVASSMGEGAAVIDGATARAALGALATLARAFEGHASDGWSLPEGTTLALLSDRWLDAIAGQIGSNTLGMYRLQMRTHLIPHFVTPAGITKATIGDLTRNRLKVVRRRTVQKDRAVLRGFLSWCVEQGHLRDMPEFPPLPRRATGTPFAIRRRGKATALSAEECAALISVLPEWSRQRRDSPRFAVQARFVVAFETALRPATLDKLSVPEHYTKGSSTLRIADEIDKNRFGRELPLTLCAREALDSIAPTKGLIFGEHDYRDPLQRAGRRALPAAKAATFTAYDLRHARLTQLAGTGDLPGVAYLAGHKQVTTTAIYVRPGLRSAESVLRASGASVDVIGKAVIRRHTAAQTAAELRSLEPPPNTEQLRAEWQCMVNLAAELLEAKEARARGARTQRRHMAPRDDRELDDLVEQVIASGRYSRLHQIRTLIGCRLSRIRESVGRLTRAGRIAKESKATAGPAPAFVTIAQVLGTGLRAFGGQP